MSDAQPTPEQLARFDEAKADPAAVSIVIEGRNGQVVTYRFPLFDYETGALSLSTENKHRPIGMLGYADGGGRQEPLPHSRIIVFRMETRIR